MKGSSSSCIDSTYHMPKWYAFCNKQLLNENHWEREDETFLYMQDLGEREGDPSTETAQIIELDLLGICLWSMST